jgi:release factor glutamine methyltransferase
VSVAIGSRLVPALLREATARLEASGCPTARQDAEWLLASVLGLARFDLYLEPRREADEPSVERLAALLERHAGGEPLQYLLGFEDFAGLRLALTRDVLIPRPETEGLVEWVAEILGRESKAVVADVGTGSGAIACALAAGLARVEVIALDVSPAALEVAAGNVRALGFGGRVRLLAGDLLAPVGGVRRAGEATGAGATRPGLDMIVANPPYLQTWAIGGLSREVAAFEPRLALDGGPDGLRVIRRLVATAPAALRPGGWLVMEIGEEQAGPVASLMAAEGFSGLESRLDLRGVERYVGGRLSEPAAQPAEERGAWPGLTSRGPRRVCG